MAGPERGLGCLRLVLTPGRYSAALRGNGPYALRLTDLGPRPEGFEAEPSEASAAAMRLRPGQSWQGDFHSAGDVDLYEITLAAPTPLTLTLTAPDDGVMRAALDLDGIGGNHTAIDPEGPALTYTAVFPAGRNVLQLEARDEGWRLTPAAVVVDVAAGGQVAVPVVVELPPMQGRVTDPQLRVMARSGGQRTAVTLPVTVDAAAAERGAHLYRVAPDGLLGGLNPLHYGLGARRFSATSAATAFPCQGPPDV